MPRLSVWFVRTALVCLVLGTLLGTIMLGAKAFPAPALVARPLPLHAELLTIGWLVNLTFGVAYWILPKHAKPPERGRAGPAWAAFILLNGGLVTAGLATITGSISWLAIARAAECCALACFAGHAWTRIKPFGAGRLRPPRSQMSA